jgi:hypothetical protein
MAARAFWKGSRAVIASALRKRFAFVAGNDVKI